MSRENTKINYNQYTPTEEQKRNNGIVEFPPVECDFKVGDLVTVTNDQGVVFPNHKVIGFSKKPLGKRFIHFDNTAWWFPCEPKNLTKMRWNKTK